MDFGQFCIMFRSIFCEGFGRPFAGVRLILKNLIRKFRRLGGELKTRAVKTRRLPSMLGARMDAARLAPGRLPEPALAVLALRGDLARRRRGARGRRPVRARAGLAPLADGVPAQAPGR